MPLIKFEGSLEDVSVKVSRGPSSSMQFVLVWLAYEELVLFFTLFHSIRTYFTMMKWSLLDSYAQVSIKNRSVSSDQLERKMWIPFGSDVVQLLCNILDHSIWRVTSYLYAELNLFCLGTLFPLHYFLPLHREKNALDASENVFINQKGICVFLPFSVSALLVTTGNWCSLVLWLSTTKTLMIFHITVNWEQCMKFTLKKSTLNFRPLGL